MPEEPTRWIDELPPALGPQAQVLRRLVAEAQADERIRILVVGCSIGRGVADEHSDIDAYVAIAPDHWSAYIDGASATLPRLGTLADTSHKRVATSGRDPYELVWALFADGVQLELVIAQAADVRPRRDWVVLHDPDRLVKDVQPDKYATVEEVREWAYDGWSTLILCAKYLARGSLWEALEMLHFARTRAWRLWAAARHIPDPQFGLTAVLDSVDPRPPPGIEATHAQLEGAAMARAALACAELTNDLWGKATKAVTGSAAPLPPAGAAARQKLGGQSSAR
jgi:hypothetical protein